MSSFAGYMKKNSPFLPLGIGMSLFGGLWIIASFQIAESFWYIFAIIGSCVFALGVLCFVIGLVSTLKARKKKG